MENYDEKLPLEFGKLELNLRSLEYLLRIFLDKKDGNKIDILQYNEGDTVPDCWETKECYLPELIKKFNKKVDSDKQLDIVAVLGLRDALAHGRILSDKPDTPMFLLNFKRKNDKENILTKKEEITLAWFQKAIEHTRKTCELVLASLD